MWIELFHVHLLRCYTNLLGVVEFTLHLFSPGLLERLLAAILPLRAMEILLPLVTWRIQEIQEIDEFHTFFLTESFRVHIFAFQIRHQRSGWPNLAMVFQVTEADLALSLLPLSLRRLPPRRRLTFFLDPYSICENIGKQMTDLSWMFFPERQALDHLVLILPALSTALSCDVAETRTSEIGH